MSEKKEKAPFFYGYVVATAGFFVWFFGWGVYAICFGVFFKPLLTEFGWTRAETSMVYSLSLIIQAALGITMGWLTDKLGPRILVTVFGSFLGWSLLLTSYVNTLWQFIICYSIVGGIGASILNIPIMATVSRWFFRQRGLMTGIVQAGASIGGFFLAPFTGWLILHYGWRRACLILGFITLAGMIVSGIFLIRDPSDKGQFPDGIPDDRPDAPASKRIDPQARGPVFRMLIYTLPFWMITGIYASFGYNRSTFNAHTAAHVQDLGFSLMDGANVLAIVSIGSMIGRVGMGRVADVIGNRRTLIISFAVLTGIIIWMMFARSMWSLYVFALVYGFCWGALAVLRFSTTAEVFGLGSVGFVMGLLSFFESIAATVGSYFGGFIFDIDESYRIAFILCAMISFIGMILSWRLKPVHSKD